MDITALVGLKAKEQLISETNTNQFLNQHQPC